MKKVKRWRYYCEFCKKSGGNAGHLQRHEKGCTNNPNRHCCFCDHGGDQKPIKELIAIVKKHVTPKTIILEKDYGMESVSMTPGDSPETALKELRDTTENCPACILSAIRQFGHPYFWESLFDFKKEKDAFWATVNTDAAESSYGYY